MAGDPDRLDGEGVADEATGPPPTRATKAGALLRGLALDVTPLRQSRDFRILWIGELISLTGRQVTLVALPFQVFLLTRSSLAVGTIGLVELAPLIVFSVAG